MSLQLFKIERVSRIDEIKQKILTKRIIFENRVRDVFYWFCVRLLIFF